MQHQLPFAELRPSELNPRRRPRSDAALGELARSIESKGVLQNLIVRNTPTGFEIVAGEGRWRGVEKLIADGRLDAGFQLPVKVIDCNDEEALEIALIENLQRENLHPLDEAEAFAKLYDLKAASGGKKAAAQAVKSIAEKLHRTPRYVQKRIKIARDLIPEWTALLDSGTINVAAAQVLASADPERQREALELTQSGWGDKATLDESKARSLSVKEISEFIGETWRAMKSALFDRVLYIGESDEVDGEIYATDREAFDALQKEAAAALMREARAKAKEGEIEFVESGDTFQPHRYDQRKQGDGAPDPAGGIFVEKRRDGEIVVYRGLFKTEDAVKDEERTKKRKAEAVKSRARMSRSGANGAGPKAEPKPDDPRIAQVDAFLKKDAHTRSAVALFDMIARGDGIDWITSEFEAGAARTVLAERAGGKLPTGAKLLAWLLEQKTAHLAEAHAAANQCGISKWDRVELIATPSKAEQLLFDHCGAKLPDGLQPPAKAKAAAKSKTASKSKPKKKGKKS